MNIFNVDFELIYNLSQKDSSANSLAEDVVIYDNNLLTGQKIFNSETTPPIRIDANTFFLCKYGEISLNVDFKTYRLTKGSTLSLNGRHIIDKICTSNNYKGYTLILSQKLLMAIIEWAPEIKNLIASSAQSEPLMEIEENELRRLVDVIERLKKNLKTTDHRFHDHMVKTETVNFILELGDIFAKRIKDGEGYTGKESRKDETIRKFIQLMLDHCKKQHEVAFYAKELCMTPGNLSRTVASASGKSPIKWISDALIAEAKIFLRNPDMNIQQIAEELHFGDQSSFGKFFKKHTGFTPIEYRGNIQGKA